MKFGFAAGFLAICLSLPTMAATLKLSPDVSLLMIDGKKVSGSLFKGSNGLELANGQHQILFKVEKVVKVSSNDDELYASAPLILNFDSTDASTVSISLPRITSKREANRFDRSPTYSLVNENGEVLPTVQDKLVLQGLVIAADLELEMARYNAGGNPASIPSLAQVTTIVPSHQGQQSTNSIPVTTTPISTDASVTLKGQTAEEEMLQYWYQRADKETRKRFLDWAKKHK